MLDLSLPFVHEALGGSFSYDALKGDFARARQLAEQNLAKAEANGDVQYLAEAQFSRAIVHMLQGETASAQNLFETLKKIDDPTVQLQSLSFNVLASFLDYNFFPDGSGSSASDIDVRWQGSALLQKAQSEWTELVPQVQDPQCLLGAWLAKEFLPSLLSIRATLQADRYNPETLTATLLETSLQTLTSSRTLMEQWQVRPSLLAYTDLAAADLCHHAGDKARAQSYLAGAQSLYQSAGDLAGLAGTFLKLGDWLSAPLSTPLVWNTALQDSGASNSHLDARTEAAELAREGLELTKAHDAYQQAAALFKKLNSQRGLGNGALRYAYLYVLDKNYTAALDKLAEAEVLFTSSGDTLACQLVRTQHALARVGAGLWPELREATTEIGHWGRSEGSFSYALGLGLFCSRVARYWLIKEGDHERALACYRLAQSLFEALGAELSAAQCLVDQSVVYRAIGGRDAALVLSEQALDAYTQALVVYPELADNLRSRTLLLSADVFGIYQQTRNTDGMARSAARLKDLVSGLPAGNSDLGTLTTLIGQGFSSLLSKNTNALATTVTNFGISRLAQTLIEQADVFVPIYRALAARDAGNNKRATDLFASAHTAISNVGGSQQAFLAATLAAHEKNYSEAARLFEGYLEQGGANAGFTGVLAQFMGRFGGTAGQQQAQLQDQHSLEQAFAFMVRCKAFDKAKAYVQRLEQIAGPGWWQADAKPWQLLSDYAEMYEGLGDLATSLHYYQTATEALETRRHLLSRDDLKTALAADQGASFLYLAAAQVALKLAQNSASPEENLKYQAQAFTLLEKGKARSLLDLATTSASLAKRPKGEADLLAAWRQKTSQIALWQGLLAQERTRQEPDERRLTMLSERIVLALDTLHALEKNLAQQNPAFYDTLNPQAKTASLAGVCAALPEDTALLQYAFSKEEMFAWALTRDGMVHVYLETLNQSTFKRLVAEFHQACEQRGSLENSGGQLSTTLLQPFLKVLETVSKLIIVPYGPTHTLPFHALRGRQGQLLCESHAVSYLPSASLLLTLGSATPTTPLDCILCIGNPAQMAYQPPLGGKAKPLKPLPAAEVEARYIASLFEQGHALLAAEATEKAVREQLANYPLLHFATHGQLSQDAPLLSEIALAGGDSLNVYELMGLRLKARLVVLSSCRSAQGQTTGGEDVLGLTRGLLSSGASAAVVSLWPVDDVSTSLLMGAFYRALRRGSEPSRALQEAQQYLRTLKPEAIAKELARLDKRLRLESSSSREYDVPELSSTRDYSHPYYWAPFVLVGT